jgi:sugar lactone lactonase YvrE
MTTRLIPRRLAASLLSIATVLGTMIACRDSKPMPTSTTGWEGRIDTLQAGRIVVHNTGRGAWDSASTWRVVEELRISDLDPAGQTRIRFINTLDVDQSGRIYLSDPSGPAIYVFDSTGKHLRSIGRRGKGPGEFLWITMLARRPDGNLVVYDSHNARMSVFDTAGRGIAFVNASIGCSMLGHGIYDSTGHLVITCLDTGSNGAWFSLRFDSLFHAVDTLRVPSPSTQSTKFVGPDGTARIGPDIPFISTPFWMPTTVPDVWTGMTSDYRLYRVSLSGDTTLIVERTGIEHLPVTAADIDSSVVGTGWLTKHGFKVDRSRIPSEKPLLTDLLVDDSGYLWVEPMVANDHGKIWDIFNPDGRYLGRIHTPYVLQASSLFRSLIRGDRIYTPVSEDGGYTLVVGRIIRGH